MAEPTPLPEFRSTDPQELVNQLNALVQTLELRLRALEAPLTDEVFEMSNVTEVRTLDADSTTLAEVADVLGTLIEDLQNSERLR